MMPSLAASGGGRCPTCGRRCHRSPRRPIPIAGPAPLPLFVWAARRAAAAAARSAPARIVLLDACRDAAGEPRPALLIPGRRHPTVFPTLAAALAALRHMEAAAHVGH